MKSVNLIECPSYADDQKMRRRLFLLLSAAASTSATGWAQENLETTWPIWTVEDHRGKIYLTGETPPRARAWSDIRIESLLIHCSALWTETNQIHIKDTQALIKRYGVDGAVSLFSKLTPSDQNRLARAAELSKIPLESLASLRPWTAGSALETAYYDAMNLQESGTVEKVLAAKAKRIGLPICSEFPTNDDVVEFMGNMSQQEDVQYLQYVLDIILDGLTENERIYELWSRGDMSGAEGVLARMKKNQPDLYEKHVVKRNKNWVPRVDSMLNNSAPALVVVGLYHLAGPDSIFVNLRKMGYSVRLG